MASTATSAPAGHGHPSLEEYVKIAVLLAVITVVEVTIYYIPALRGVLVPLLIALSAVKFLYVIGYFMHLKFDDPLLRALFVAAVIIAIIIFLGVWAVMHFDFPSVFNANMSIFPEKPMLD